MGIQITTKSKFLTDTKHAYNFNVPQEDLDREWKYRVQNK